MKNPEVSEFPQEFAATSLPDCSHKFRVFTAGQKRRVTPANKRLMQRQSAVEPVIMGRNHLSRRTARRRHQRHSRRRRLQLLPPAQMAEGILVQESRRAQDAPNGNRSMKIHTNGLHK